MQMIVSKFRINTNERRIGCTAHYIRESVLDTIVLHNPQQKPHKK